MASVLALAQRRWRYHREAMAVRPLDRSRRRFLHGLALGGAAAALPRTLTASRGRRVASAAAAVRIGVIGLNGRGRDHVRGFGRLPDVRVTALCDCDRAVLDRAVAEARQAGHEVQAFADPRRLLASGTVDAVAIATPNHWHSLLGVWACEHGRDAYVEKPVSHDVWEGAQLVAAAQKHGRIVASGLQCRSNPGLQQAIAFARSGALGRITLARGLCYKPRTAIGKVAAPPAPPATVDYELWLGPAAMQPVRRERFHYDWHWQWDFGNGDLGNQGVHQMDLCRQALGVASLPTRVLSFGGRVGYDDDGETPNTQVVWLDFDGAPIVFEVRGLPARRGGKDMDAFLGCRIGVVLHCEGGAVVMPDYASARVLDEHGKQMRTFAGEGDHYANFVAAVRARDAGLLTASALEGHLSSACCHLGNASLRQGAGTRADAIGTRLQWQPAASEAWARMAEHLRCNGLEPGDLELQCGALLRPDPDASAHPRRTYRAPFVLEAQQ